MAANNSKSDVSCQRDKDKEPQSGRPQVTDANIVQILQKVYGFNVHTIKELDGYFDRNYHVLVDDKHTHPHIGEICPHGYIFKVHNEAETNTAHLDAQLEVMQRLTRNGFSCSKPVPNVHGEYRSRETMSRTEITNNNGRTSEGNSDPEHTVRLLTYLPGKLLINISPTTQLLYAAGQRLAEMDRILQGYTHPSLAILPEWYVNNVAHYRPLVDHMGSLEDQQLLHQALLTFEEEVVPMYPSFQRGVIHGDYHQENVIIQSSSNVTDEPNYYISGVIDFSDMAELYYVFEVGIALAHVMMNSPEDALGFAGHLLAGYQSKFRLSKEEVTALPGIITARLVQVLLVGADSLQTDPGNEYIAHWHHGAWIILRKLSTLSRDDIFQEWQRVVTSYDNVTLDFML